MSAEKSTELLPLWQTKLSQLKGFLFDVDDLLLQRIPESLRIKLASFSLWHESGDNSHMKTYRTMLQDERWKQTAFRQVQTEEYCNAIDPVLLNLINGFIEGHVDEQTREDIIHKLGFSQEDFWEQYRIFSQQTEQGLPMDRLISPAPGINELLDEGIQRGMPLGIVSNSSRTRLNLRLSALPQDTLNKFSVIVSASDLSKGLGINVKKPHHFAITYGIHRLGLDSQSSEVPVAYFGNGVHDMKAATGARVSVPVFIGENPQASETILSVPSIPHFTDLLLKSPQNV